MGIKKSRSILKEFAYALSDLLNVGISLCRGRWKEAVLKIGKTGGKALDRLEITYKALSGKTADLKKYLDDGTELFFKIVDDTGIVYRIRGG